MAREIEYSDPFGAPTYYINDMILEEASPGVVLARILSRENGESILRCTLVMSEAVVKNNMTRTNTFMGFVPITVVPN